MPKTKPKRRKIQQVHLLEAKPNPMFPDWLTERLRYLRYYLPVKCAYCGKEKKFHWTLFFSFRIMEGFEKKVDGKVIEWNSLVGFKGAELFPPLTPVCSTHILAPEV